jgi:hypothetical protein
MDWARIEAQWQHYKVLAHIRWGRITAEDLDVIAGRRALLALQIHQIYGVSREAAQMQLESWQGQQREPGAS